MEFVVEARGNGYSDMERQEYDECIQGSGENGISRGEKRLKQCKWYRDGGDDGRMGKRRQWCGVAVTILMVKEGGLLWRKR